MVGHCPASRLRPVVEHEPPSAGRLSGAGPLKTWAYAHGLELSFIGPAEPIGNA